MYIAPKPIKLYYVPILHQNLYALGANFFTHLFDCFLQNGNLSGEEKNKTIGTLRYVELLIQFNTKKYECWVCVPKLYITMFLKLDDKPLSLAGITKKN